VGARGSGHGSGLGSAGLCLRQHQIVTIWSEYPAHSDSTPGNPGHNCSQHPHAGHRASVPRHCQKIKWGDNRRGWPVRVAGPRPGMVKRSGSGSRLRLTDSNAPSKGFLLDYATHGSTGLLPRERSACHAPREPSFSLSKRARN
jgi:hypothetical protein